MSVGKSHHYLIHQVLSRHFLQTVEQAGVGLKGVTAIIDELRDTTAKSVASVVDLMGNSIPRSVSEAIQKGIIQRIERLGINED